jgi:hypothetical protein
VIRGWKFNCESEEGAVILGGSESDLKEVASSREPEEINAGEKTLGCCRDIVVRLASRTLSLYEIHMYIIPVMFQFCSEGCSCLKGIRFVGATIEELPTQMSKIIYLQHPDVG